ncbi:MAG: preprotein translocase subunit SecG [Gammaproteobacteria bacterium]|nr:preprotein translocase subunit SecG [Gammaproteobacteria bacterium]
MTTFETVLLMLLVVDAIALGGLVLLQQGRGADVGAAFGSGTSNTMFGGGGGTSFLTKVTVCLAIGFFLISFGLAYAANERAATAQDVGVPGLTMPDEQPGQLTPEEEGVDSDIPDV